MSTGATFEGVEHLRDTLDVAARSLEDLAGPASEAGEVIKPALVAESPKRTGYLSTTVSSTVAGQAVTVTVAAPYAAAVNARDPFKARALDASTNQVIDIYTQAAVEIVDRIEGV